MHTEVESFLVMYSLQSDWATQFHATAKVNDSSDIRPFYVDAKGRGSQSSTTLEKAHQA